MIRLGMTGTGRIAHRFVPEAAEAPGVSITGVYHPRFPKAKAFAKECSIPLCTDDPETLSENVDAVYIASPHRTHFEYAEYFLKRGKHVLCEKPLCLQKKQAETLFQLAKRNRCVLMEAVKTACCPGFSAMMEIAESGRIGRIRDVEACFTRLTATGGREFLDTSCGGSLTEFGSYTLLPILRLMGTGYSGVTFQALLDRNGVDEYTKVYLEYGDGMALSKTGLSVKSEGQLLIAGTKGYVLSPSPWWLTKKFELRFEEPDRREEFTFPFEGQGLRYEIRRFVEAVNGKECAGGVSREESIAMAGIMEAFLEWRGRRGRNEESG